MHRSHPPLRPGSGLRPTARCCRQLFRRPPMTKVGVLTALGRGCSQIRLVVGGLCRGGRPPLSSSGSAVELRPASPHAAAPPGCAPRQGRLQLPGCRAATAPEATTTSAPWMLAARHRADVTRLPIGSASCVNGKHWRAFGSEPWTVIAQVDEHFGDATHAAAANAHEVDGVDAPHAIAAARAPRDARPCGRAFRGSVRYVRGSSRPSVPVPGRQAASSSAARGFASRRARSAMASNLPRPAAQALQCLAASSVGAELAVR